jgi:hypothetical protein
MYRSIPLLDCLFDNDNQKTTFIDSLTRYHDGQGPGIFRETYNAVKSKNEDSLKILFVLERLMVQIGMLKIVPTAPDVTSTLDLFAAKYTDQDLILVLTLLTFGLVLDKFLVKPQFPRVRSSKKPKLVADQEKLDEINRLRLLSDTKLVTIKEIRETWVRIDARVSEDRADFYEALNTSSDAVKMWTNARNVAFDIWSTEAYRGSTKGDKNNQEKGGNKIEDKDKKRKRSANAVKGIKWDGDTSDSEGDDDAFHVDCTWL